MRRRISLSRSPQSFGAREREAFVVSQAQQAGRIHELELELEKAKRELVAARLLISIQRVKEDPRIHTTTSMDEEMGEYVYSILYDREVEVLTYEDAKLAWDLKRSSRGA